MLVQLERVNFLMIHKNISDYYKAKIESLRKAGLHIKDIKNVFVTQVGGH